MRAARSASILLAATMLALVLVPAAAYAGVTYATDSFEPADNGPVNATDVTPLFTAGRLGGVLQLQGHTISLASTTSPGSFDQDWFKFTVTDGDLRLRTSYLIETDSRAAFGAFRVIEVYESEGLAYTNPPAAKDWDYNLSWTTCIAPAGNIGDRWHDDYGVSTVCFEPTAAGVYYFRVRPWNEGIGGMPSDLYGASAGPYTLRVKKGFMSRAAGADRVLTSVGFSRELYPAGALTDPGSDAWGESVVVANGWNYPDGLAGSALAGQLNGPLLLTRPTYLSGATREEIERLRPKHIYVLGGSSSVATAVLTALEELPSGAHATVERIGGANRAETAKLIAQKLYAGNGGDPIGPAFVVNGWSFADALSIAPLAALNHSPILLTHTTSLDTYTQQAIHDYGITDVIIVGDTNAVSNGVAGMIQTLMPGMAAGHVRRVYGSTRYETSMEVALFSSGLRGNDGGEIWRVGTTLNPGAFQALDPHQIGIASGQDFPDALSGGVWCGKSQAPLLLTPTNYVSPYIYTPGSHTTPAGTSDYWYIVKDETGQGFKRSYVFGGASAVSTPTYTQLDSYTGRGGH